MYTIRDLIDKMAINSVSYWPSIRSKISGIVVSPDRPMSLHGNSLSTGNHLRN
jgi:hypothetical protein